MDDTHTRRLREEMKRMLKTYPPAKSVETGISWKVVGGDLHMYELTISGKIGTPYEGGIWTVTIRLPPEYPFKPPIVNFIQPIYHPNIALEGRQWPWGSNVCLSLVNWDNLGKPGGWKETIFLPSVVDHLEMMLEVYPLSGEDQEFPEYLVDPKDPFNPEAGEEMIENFDLFFDKAKEWTEEHAWG